MLRQFPYYLNGTDPLILPKIFIFLSCHEKAHDKRHWFSEAVLLKMVQSWSWERQTAVNKIIVKTYIHHLEESEKH